MDKERFVLTIFVFVCSLAFIERMVEQAFGGQRPSKEQVTFVGVLEPPKPLSKQTQKPPVNTHVKKSVARADPGLSPDVPPVQIKRVPTESKTTARKGREQVRIHKKVVPKVVVQPRTDLMYYGVLEDSQRYDPRPNPHHAGVPNPQTVDLTHDHFQELDRNQDGRIDPVERAFGRIDMDRDLHNRQLH
jgi:hypothetical protein